MSNARRAGKTTTSLRVIKMDMVQRGMAWICTICNDNDPGCLDCAGLGVIPVLDEDGRCS